MVVKEEKASRAERMRQQGAWTRWNHAESRTITWADVWWTEPHRMKFLIQGVWSPQPIYQALLRFALSVREEEPSSTSRVVAQSLLGTVSTVGGTTRCSIILQRPSVVPFPNAAELNSQSITPVSSALERGHAHQQKQPLCFWTEQRTGTWWWTWSEKPPSNLFLTLSMATKTIIMLELTVAWEECIDEGFE